MSILLESPSAKAHQQQIGKDDAFFALSNRHYLCQTLNHAERVHAARYCYTFVDTKFDAVSRSQILANGYTIWSSSNDEHTFAVRLLLGNDNMYEGGLSAVFFVDDQRVGVMSFSIIDGQMLGLETSGPVVLIGRNQTTSDRWYQKPLQDAFKQIALPYMMLASVAGIGRGLGCDAIYAVTENYHPHVSSPAEADVMKASYSAFWSKYHATPQREGIVRLTIPLESTPLDQVSSNHRRRAKARREVMEQVAQSSADAMIAASIA